VRVSYGVGGLCVCASCAPLEVAWPGLWRAGAGRVRRLEGTGGAGTTRTVLE
jgi:hypothetical protein